MNKGISKGQIDKARRLALKALVDLSHEEPNLYYSGIFIVERIPKDAAYGKIYPNSIHRLLDQYVRNELVMRAEVYSPYGRIRGHRINLERKDDINKLIRDLV